MLRHATRQFSPSSDFRAESGNESTLDTFFFAFVPNFAAVAALRTVVQFLRGLIESMRKGLFSIDFSGLRLFLVTCHILGHPEVCSERLLKLPCMRKGSESREFCRMPLKF